MLKEDRGTTPSPYKLAEWHVHCHDRRPSTAPEDARDAGFPAAPFLRRWSMSERSRDQQGDGYETGAGPQGGSAGGDERGHTDRDADRDIDRATPDARPGEEMNDREDRARTGQGGGYGSSGSRRSRGGGTSDADATDDAGTGKAGEAPDGSDASDIGQTDDPTRAGSNYGGYGADTGYTEEIEREVLEEDAEADGSGDDASARRTREIDLAGGVPGTGRSGDYNYDVDELDDEREPTDRGSLGAIRTSSRRSVGTEGRADDMSGTQGTSGASGNLGDTP